MSIIYYTIPSGIGLYGTCLGPDNNIWFCSSRTDTGGGNTGLIGNVTPSGVITTIEVGFACERICTGSDGNLWFTSEPNNCVASCTNSGGITSYPIPTSSSNPVGICSGPDGNIWFCE